MNEPVKSHLADLIERLSTSNVDNCGSLTELENMQRFLRAEEIKQEGIEAKLILDKKVLRKPIQDYLPVSSARSPQSLVTIRFISDLYNHPRVEHLPLLLKQLLYQIRLPMIRLALLEIKDVLKENSPPLQLIKELLRYECFWKDESQLGFPIYSKLSQLLMFSSVETGELPQSFKNALKPIIQIRENQSKRASIFEKRLLEAEQSKIKTNQANGLIKQIIQKLTNEIAEDSVVSDFLTDYWGRLLVLDFLRKDDQLFYSSVAVMVKLVESVTPPKTNQQLTGIIDSLAELNQAMLVGLSRLSIEEATKKNLLSSIESIHISIISGAQSSLANEINAESKNELRVKNNEEIVRLKPTNILDQIGKPYTKKKTTKRDNLEKSSPPEASIKGSTKRKVSLNVTGLIEHIFEHPNDVYGAFNLDFFTKTFYREVTKDSSSKMKTIDDDFALKEGAWCYFTSEEQIYKLLNINRNVGEYVFIDRNVKPVHRLASNELLTQLTDGQILVVEQSDLVDRITEKISLDKKFVQSLKKLLDVPKAIPTKQSFDASPPDLKRNTPPVVIETTQKTELRIDAPKDLTELVVGSWINLLIDEKMRKCKLAAKIPHKNIYIFVDRQGKKLAELKTQELDRLLAHGDLVVLESGTLTDSVLKSLISNTREQKNENQPQN